MDQSRKEILCPIQDVGLYPLERGESLKSLGREKHVKSLEFRGDINLELSPSRLHVKTA